MWYGAAYYPEHWPEERWRLDARLMREAGFNVARLGEFAWARMEPAPDLFDFDWLERAVAILQAEGISVLLGTPTAGPPAWLVNAASPEDDCRMVYEDSGRWQFGGRSLCCVNHPRFVERSRRIAAALGERFAANPAVMGFQIDNELGMYGTRCHCDICLAKFREWMKARYGTIEAVNGRLGMIFGGGLFGDFDDIPFPRLKQDLHNPGLVLESQRFVSDCNVRYVRMQAAALREAGVRRPVATNVCHMMSGAGIDEHALFADLDVAGWDCYPQQFAADPPPSAMGLLHAMARGYKNKPYWMLEQQSGSPMGMAAGDVRRIRLWAWQSVAHGADMVLFFRWRTARFGGEQYWRGILDHDGRPNPRYEVVSRLGAEIAKCGRLLSGLARSNDAAILLDFDACTSFHYGPSGARLSYRAHAESYFAALQKHRHGADVVFEPPEPGRYRLLVAPALRLMDQAWAARLWRFVEAGGTLLATVCTATLNRDHVAPDEPMPWLLADLFGVTRVEWSSLGKRTVSVAAESGPLKGEYVADTWCDHVRADSAEVLARFGAGSPAEGYPAVTLNAFGAGRAVCVAALVEQRLADRLAAMLADAPADAPKADSALVEIVRCEREARPLYFLLNHGASPALVRFSAPVQDVLRGSSPSGEIALEPYDVAIVEARSPHGRP